MSKAMEQLTDLKAIQTEHSPLYLQYWGKAAKNQDGHDNYHRLVYHSLDVAAVAKQLLADDKPLTRTLAQFLELSPLQLQQLIVFALALHDLGKFASAFQALYQHNNPELVTPESRKSYDGKNYRHDRMGLYFWNDFLKSKSEDVFGQTLSSEQRSSLLTLMRCSLGHHGQPIDETAIRSIRHFTEKHNREATQLFTSDIFKLIQPDLPYEKMASEIWRKKLEQVSWQIAGIAVLADWIGSDATYFTYNTKSTPLADYWRATQKTASRALAGTDLGRAPTVKPFLSIEKYYGFKPTPLQSWAESVPIDDTPQLFILEDVTGAGKTEAALALTHRLMESGAADGFYFGLPTMATSNAMFSRIAKHYLQMLSTEQGKPSIVLAHGAREMSDLFRNAVLSSNNPDSHYHPHDNTATAQCNQWLADSRKKALLAPVGVGTIDQALLTVLPRKHQSLRLLGLHRKVLIFDEVHAADEFMFELLESLLGLHLHQGGSVILLTATLSHKQRSRLAAIWHKAVGLTPIAPQNKAFPLATKVSINPDQPLLEQALDSRSDVCREVAVKFVHNTEDCITKVLESAGAGQCVVWVRNSVDDALAAFQLLQKKLPKPENCLLFHSRFILQDRKAIEKRVLDIFGKSSTHKDRDGKVLIATQVFQESLDADADLMISDICPIDDLIQRTGRLHRHTRNAQREHQLGIKDKRKLPALWVHAPEWTSHPEPSWLREEFLNTQYVYRSPGRLWLGMRELLDLGSIKMPNNARQLIESVYGEDAYERIPETLKQQENELVGEERSKAAKARSQLLDWQRYGYSQDSSSAWYEDNLDISTRHSDIETIEVLLLKEVNGELRPWAEAAEFSIPLSTVKLSKNKFADKLQKLPEAEEEQFKQKNRAAKYLQCWLPERDDSFKYNPTTGFHGTKDV